MSLDALSTLSGIDELKNNSTVLNLESAKTLGTIIRSSLKVPKDELERDYVSLARSSHGAHVSQK